METYLGVDLGGTKLLIGEVDFQGNILQSKRYASGYLDQLKVVATIKDALDDYTHNVGLINNPLSMGVDITGRVNPKEGIWYQIDPNRTSCIPICNVLSGIYNIPCFVDNDVKGATRAEKIWGTGQTSQNFIYINVGTGIAAGVVSDGRMIRGSHFNAGEVGHMNAGVRIGVQCDCGKTDCVEAVASGLGFDRCARFLHASYPTSLVIPENVHQRIDVREIFRLSREGDELCKTLVDIATESLANLIMNMVREFDPDTVVLGGGVVSDGFLMKRILKRLNPNTMRFVANGVTLTNLDPATIGLLGAAAVAMNKE